MLPPEQGQGPWTLMAGPAGPRAAYPVFGRWGAAGGVCVTGVSTQDSL